ncbi:hypothetical protein I6G82_23450 [Lysinibacillus macroides]|uniref:hypothetical protein n=1 Tax=Lysinibacillus macroides TaxID=33935 RepID=UPI000ADBA15A|nr:hypothetical protein [Lysinibacillus macroides]QPR68080.1 hypothetical protein I6G82_23450 [Lysinibacillus macroides]
MGFSIASFQSMLSSAHKQEKFLKQSRSLEISYRRMVAQTNRFVRKTIGVVKQGT